MGVNITSRILGEATDERLKDPQAAYHYAKDVLNGRFPEGEAAIAKNTWIALYYATQSTKGRFPEGEAAIAMDPIASYKYATEVIKGRFPEGEDVIATSPGCAAYAVDYAINVIKGRWPEAEEAITRALKDSSDEREGGDEEAALELIRKYINAFPEVSKLEWVMNGLLDWLDL